MLRKIKLYGKLAKFIGHRVLEADVATAAEAVRFLLANWPEVQSATWQISTTASASAPTTST
jgi:predicted phage tail protein